MPYDFLDRTYEDLSQYTSVKGWKIFKVHKIGKGVIFGVGIKIETFLEKLHRIDFSGSSWINSDLNFESNLLERTSATSCTNFACLRGKPSYKRRIHKITWYTLLYAFTHHPVCLVYIIILLFTLLLWCHRMNFFQFVLCLTIAWIFFSLLLLYVYMYMSSNVNKRWEMGLNYFLFKLICINLFE